MLKTCGNKALTTAAMLLLVAERATAAGFQSTTHSAAGVGRANAGEAVIADNASVLGRNPAAMTRFDRPAVSGGLNLVMPMTEVTDASANGLGQSVAMPDEDLNSVRPSPHFYLIQPLSDRFAVGTAVYSNFATGTEFSTSFNKSGALQGAPIPALGGLVGGKTEVTTVNLNVSAAYEVIKGLSLGLGLDVLYGSGTFERPAYVFGNDTGAGLNFEGDGWSFGWDAGLMYEINEGNRFGLSYHSGMAFTAEGDGSAGGETFDETKLNLPARAEFSGFHQVARDWALHYSLQWIGWSAFDQIEFGDLVKEYNWENTLRYAVGTTYTISPAWTWRAGLAYDESPVKAEYRTVSIPDSNRIWYSTGATWTAASQHSSVDIAFTYIQGEQLDVSETAASTPLGDLVVNSSTDTNAVIVGASYNYRF